MVGPPRPKAVSAEAGHVPAFFFREGDRGRIQRHHGRRRERSGSADGGAGSGTTMARSSVIEDVTRLVEPVARERGLDLVDVEFLPSGRRSVLRFTLDREGGIGLDDLAEASREMSDVLDAHDVVPGAYVLECSSPGVNRPDRKRVV